MPDPRLNCAAGVCCDPIKAQAARVAILVDLGVPKEYCEMAATAMPRKGISFASTDLMKAISDIADHPDLKSSG